MPEHAADPDFESEPEFKFGPNPDDFDLDPNPRPDWDGEEMGLPMDMDVEMEMTMDTDPDADEFHGHFHDSNPEFSREAKSYPNAHARPPGVNKYRRALEVLGQARETLVDSLADEVLDNADEFRQGGFFLNEFLDVKGPRMQFLGVIAGFLEQAADTLDEQRAAASYRPHGYRRRRSSSSSVEPYPASGNSPEE